MVLGLLLGAAAGALVFKLGMDAQKMSSDGKGAGEIAGAMPGLAADNVKRAVDSCGSVFGCCGGPSPCDTKGDGDDVYDAEVVDGPEPRDGDAEPDR